MPEFNDTTGQVKTSYIVQVDAKAEGFERINLPRGAVDIPEGALMVRDANGVANLPDPGTIAGGELVDSRMVYINFSNPNAPQTSDRAVWNEVGGTRYSVQLEAGGFAGILGHALRVTLPYDNRFFLDADIGSINVNEPVTLKREADGGDVRPSEVKFGRPTGAPLASGMPTLLGAPTAAESDLRFATVDAIDTGAGKITLIFNSIGAK